MKTLSQEVWATGFALVILLVMILVSSPLPLLAADRSVPFEIGETLDPGLDAQPCGPLDANCFPTLTNIVADGGVGSIQYASSSGLLTSSSTLLYFDAPGKKLGIGTSTPQHALSVVGNFGLTGAIFDSNNNSGVNGYVLQTTGAGVAWVATSSLGISGGGGSSNWLDNGTYLSTLTNGRGIAVNGSSTIGNGTAAGGLTIFGNATTTGKVHFGMGADTDIYINGGNPNLAVQNGNNIAIGNEAFVNFDPSSVYNSIAIGYQALMGSSSFPMYANDNVAIGSQTLTSNLYGIYNVAIGSQSQYNTQGDYNTAVGGGTLYSNTWGDLNTAIGSFSMYYNTIGNQNVAVGDNALNRNVDGDENNAIGSYSLNNNITGNKNSALGSYALQYNASGSDNSAIGYLTLSSNTTGSYSTAIGNRALQVSNRGSANTALGYEAGSSLGNSTATSSNNTFLGYRAGYTQTRGDNNLLIGFNTSVASTTGSNQFSLGNILYGSGLGSGGSVTAGNLSVGVPTPYAKFSIQNTYGSSTALFDIASTTSAGNATSSLFRVNSDGTVGIGTSTPSHPLALASGAHVTAGGVWTNSSDQNLKENFTELDPLDILNKLNQLPISEWNYKTEDKGIRHIGPTAQDFYGLFSLGGSDTSISTIDPAGVSLVAIQGLSKELWSLASGTPSTKDDSFAAKFFIRLRVWLADTKNEIKNLFADRIQTNTLCVGNTCITESQLLELLNNSQSATVFPTLDQPHDSTEVEVSTPSDEESTNVIDVESENQLEEVQDGSTPDEMVIDSISDNDSIPEENANENTDSETPSDDSSYLVVPEADEETVDVVTNP